MDVDGVLVVDVIYETSHTLHLFYLIFLALNNNSIILTKFKESEVSSWTSISQKAFEFSLDFKPLKVYEAEYSFLLFLFLLAKQFFWNFLCKVCGNFFLHFGLIIFVIDTNIGRFDWILAIDTTSTGLIHQKYDENW